MGPIKKQNSRMRQNETEPDSAFCLLKSRMTYNTFTSIPGVTYTSKVYSALYQPKCRMNSYTFTSIQLLGITYTYKKCYFCKRAPSISIFLLCCYASLHVLRNSKPSVQTPEALKCFHSPRLLSHCVLGLIHIISNIEYISKTI